MKENVLCATLGSLLFAVGFPVGAQQPAKIPRLGYVAASANPKISTIEAFRQGLKNLGYVEGKNILVEYRYAEGMEDRLPGLVDELVQLRVDVLIIPPLSVQPSKRPRRFPLL